MIFESYVEKIKVNIAPKILPKNKKPNQKTPKLVKWLNIPSINLDNIFLFSLIFELNSN